MKSILLINPMNSETIRASGYYLMPLSLLYLSGTAKLYAETHIIDLNVEKAKYNRIEKDGKFPYLEFLKKEIERFSPDFVGITCLFSGQIEMVFDIADVAKQVCPKTITIIGGIHPTIFCKEILQNCPNIDVVVIGEGEKTLEKLLTLDMDEWRTINGVAYKDKQGELVFNDNRAFVDDVDEIPKPEYSMFNFEDYRLDSSDWYNPKKFNIGTSAPILTSRSCPFKCNFCAMHFVMGSQFRARSAENVFEEMQHLYNHHGVRYFNIMDDNFSLDKKRVKKFCRLIIDSKMDISFDVPNGIMTQTIDDEVVDLLAQAGLAYCFLAVESGSDFIRNKVMNKHLSEETIYRVIKSFRRYPKIHILVFFIMGMPEDTRETLDETYAMIEKLDIDDFKVSVATPFPGTRLFEQCTKDNLFVKYSDTKDVPLWRSTEWHQRILNDESHFFIKPYKMEIKELEEYAFKFECLRHEKHLITVRAGRQTYSIVHAMEDFNKKYPNYKSERMS